MQLPLPGASIAQDLLQQLRLLEQLLLVFEAQAELPIQRPQSPQHGGRGDCDKQASDANKEADQLLRRGGDQVEVFLRDAIDPQQGPANHCQRAVITLLAIRV